MSDDTPTVDVVVPVCATCGVPYVLRVSYVMTGGGRREWLYHRDCKHRGQANGKPDIDGTAPLNVPDVRSVKRATFPTGSAK